LSKPLKRSPNPTRSFQRALRAAPCLKGPALADCYYARGGGGSHHSSGGRIVMGNWIPNDPTLVAQILKISAAYSPPPPEGFVSPMTWGIENNVLERFASAGVPKENISFVRDTYTFNFSAKPSELVDAFRKYYGPTMNAFEAADKNDRAGNLQAELEGLFNSQNKSTNNNATSIPATFLRVTAVPG
jgi:hypothetical protein